MSITTWVLFYYTNEYINRKAAKAAKGSLAIIQFYFAW